MIIVLNCQIKLAVLSLVVCYVVVAHTGSSIVADLLEDLASFCKVNYCERIRQFEEAIDREVLRGNQHLE